MIAIFNFCNTDGAVTMMSQAEYNDKIETHQDLLQAKSAELVSFFTFMHERSFTAFFFYISSSKSCFEMMMANAKIFLVTDYHTSLIIFVKRIRSNDSKDF